MARDGSFHCELEKSKDKNENQVTTIKCHGELVSDTAGEIKELVRPLIPLGGRIIIDLGHVKHWIARASEHWLASRRPQSSRGHASLNSPT
jgi:hypothetical protein